MQGARCFIVCCITFLAVITAGASSAVTHDQASEPHEFELTLSEKEWLSHHPVIRVRISPGYPPFEFYENGTFQGIEVDYLTIIGRRLGVEFRPVFAEITWAEALDRFRDRDGVDMILGITHTAEREEFAVFTDDYVSFPQVVFSRKDSPFISGVKDLDGMKVAMERGYVMRDWLSRDVPGIRFVDVDRSGEALDAVATGQADAYVGSLAVGSYFIEKKGLVSLKVAAPTPYGVDAMAMAIRKDWPELALLINRALRSMSEDDHRAIRTRWLSLRYEHGLNVRDVVTWTVTIIVAAMFWIIPLRVMVKRRTTELQKEVQQRREGEQKLRLILDNAPYAVYALSHEGKGLYINKSAEKMVGYTTKELLSMHFLDLVHPDDHAMLLKIREARIAERPAESTYIIRVFDKAGSVLWVENHVIALSWEGNPATLNFIQDITERKRAEEELRESETFRKRVFESSRIPIIVMEAASYKYIDCNPAAVDIYRFTSRTETLGKTPMDVSAPIQYDGTPSPEKARYYVEKALAENTVVFEWRHQRPDGEIWDAEVHLMSFLSGESQLLQFTLQDITARKKAEEELAKSEERFRTAFSTNPDAIIISRINDGVMIDVNQGFTNVTGYTREDVLNRDGSDLGIWAVPEDRRRFVEQLKASGTVNNLETQFRRKDGNIIYGSVTARVIMLDNAPHALSIGKDITERIRTEEALRERDELYRGFFWTALDAIFIISAEERLIDFNEAMEKLLGYSRDELLTLGGSQKNRISSLYADPGQVTQALVQFNETGYLKEYPVEMKRRDGARIDALLTMTALKTPNGTIKARVGTIRDVTEKKRAEEERERLIADIRTALGEVSRSQKEWQDTFDNITEMISIHDTDFNIIRANRAFSENLGLSPDEVLNRKCYELMHHGATAPVAGCPHIRSLENRIPVTEELYDEHNSKTLRVTTYPYFSPEGTIIGTIHIARDVTEEKEREMQLIMTERLASLGQMASGIAHEINNPLASVMMCAEMLMTRVVRDTYDHAQFEKYLKTIDEEVQRCRDITINMLSFARQSATEKQDIDVHLLLDKAIDLVGFQGRLKNVEVVKQYGARVLVKGNEGELRQVFLTLVVNALDAMKNTGTLKIETGRQGNDCLVRVSDTGPGIPPEIRQKIFQPFFTTKVESGGTGLGLSIAYRIISNHRGSIDVNSDSGTGAAFTVSLPC